MISPILLAITIQPLHGQRPLMREARESLVRIYFQNQDELNRLARQLDVWKVNRKGSFAIAAVDRHGIDQLRAEGVRVEVEPEMQTALSADLDLSCYRSVEQIEAELHSLARAYPDLVQLTDIGDSWQKRQSGDEAGYDLWALKITRNSIPGPKPRFLLLAGTHAREFAPPELALAFVKRLLAGYDEDPDITWILDYQEIHVIPLLNPDGHKYAEQGYYQRKNTNLVGSSTCPVPVANRQPGVDLNRNADWFWGQDGSSDHPCDPIYRGESAASEPETQAIQNYILELFPDQRGEGETDAAPEDSTGIFITLHSFGNLVLWGWAFSDQPAPNLEGLRAIGQRLGALNGYESGQASKLLYLGSGQIDDFTYGTTGVPSFTFEIGDWFFPDCAQLSDLFAGNFEALLYAARIAGAPYQLVQGPEIHRGGSYAVTTGTALEIHVDIEATDSDKTVASAEATIDAPPWTEAPRMALAPIDGAFDSRAEGARLSVPAGQLSPGRHMVFLRACDSEGNWGPVTSMFVDVESDPAPDLKLSIERTGNLRPGGTISYDFKVFNRGPGIGQTPILLTDSLPRGLRLLSASGQDWQCDPAPPDETGYRCVRTTQLEPGETGRVRITAEVEADAGVLLVNRGVVSTDRDRNPLNNEAVDSLTLLEPAAQPKEEGGSLYFPHFADGAGLSTVFVLSNPASSPASGSLIFYDRAGNELAFPVNQEERSRVTFDLPPNGMVSIATDGTSVPAKSGYAKASSDRGMVSGMAIYRYSDGRETGALGVEARRRFSVPVERSATTDSGVAVWRSSTLVPVEVSLYSQAGELLGTAAMELAGYQGASFVSEIFRDLPEFFSGTLKIESTVPIAPLALRFGQQVLSTLPVRESKPPGQVMAENLVGMWVFSYPAEGVSYLDRIPILETWEDEEQPERFWVAGVNRNSGPVLGFCEESGANLVLVSPSALYDDVYHLEIVGEETVSGCYYSRYHDDGSYSRCYALSGVKMKPELFGTLSKAVESAGVVPSSRNLETSVRRILTRLVEERREGKK